MDTKKKSKLYRAAELSGAITQLQTGQRHLMEVVTRLRALGQDTSADEVANVLEALEGEQAALELVWRSWCEEK